MKRFMLAGATAMAVVLSSQAFAQGVSVESLLNNEHVSKNT